MASFNLGKVCESPVKWSEIPEALKVRQISQSRQAYLKSRQFRDNRQKYLRFSAKFAKIILLCGRRIAVNTQVFQTWNESSTLSARTRIYPVSPRI